MVSWDTSGGGAIISHSAVLCHSAKTTPGVQQLLDAILWVKYGGVSGSTWRKHPACYWVRVQQRQSRGPVRAATLCHDELCQPFSPLGDG